MADLTFKVARRRVEQYNATDDELIQASREAMDCYDCEAFLQMGIDAFDWLMRADLVIRRAVYLEADEYDENIEVAMKGLCQRWLKPCKPAFAWADIQKKHGYEVANLKEFQHRCKEMQAIVDSFSEDSVAPESVVVLSKSAIQEHRDGQTTEFF